MKRGSSQIQQKKQLVLEQIVHKDASVFLFTPWLHPSPPPHCPSWADRQAPAVTAGITCQASGALLFANGLISCVGGHPISPEIHSLATLSSLTRLCQDLPGECCDVNSQEKERTALIACLVYMYLFASVFVRFLSRLKTVCSSFLFERDFFVTCKVLCSFMQNSDAAMRSVAAEVNRGFESKSCIFTSF